MKSILNTPIPFHNLLLPIILWPIVGAAFGVAASLLSQVCLLAIPAWPGAFLAVEFGGHKTTSLIHCSGGDWVAVLPYNVAFYSIIGFMFGLFMQHRSKQKGTDAFTCSLCGYSLIGSISGKCPECGTRISRDCMDKIAAMASTKALTP